MSLSALPTQSRRAAGRRARPPCFLDVSCRGMPFRTGLRSARQRSAAAARPGASCTS